MADDGKTEIAEDIRELSFEAALAELETIVERLERGDVALEASIEIYQRGSQLRAYCDEKLHDAQMRIEKFPMAVRARNRWTRNRANTCPAFISCCNMQPGK